MESSTFEPSPAISDDSTVTQRVRAEQMALLCKHSRGAIIGASIGAWFVCWVLSSDYSLASIGLWYAALLTVSGLRVVLQARYLKAYASEGPSLRWQPYCLGAFIGIALYGLVWSLPSLLMLPAQPSRQVVLTMFMVGLAATGIGSLTSMRHAYTVFIVAFMAPITTRAFIEGGPFVDVGIGIVLFVFGMVGTGVRSALTIEDSLRLQIANGELAARLQREKSVIERANRDLEAQIAQRERTEAELRIAKSGAEAANRAKNQFLANMSHELRTPLNGVLGMSELLIRALPNTVAMAKPHKYAQAIHTAGERLLHLINDILDMARIEAGAIRFENATFDPRRLIADVLEVAGEGAAHKQLSLRAQIDPDVPREVRGDMYRLRQVLTNLVSNAVKFTEHGSVEVRLSVVRSGEPSLTQHVRLRWAVIDTGIGIAAQSRAQLFQPFSQLDASFTRRFGGTGLGLAICRQIVTALGGAIDVDSTPGVGSTFWFEVPLEFPDHTATARGGAAPAAGVQLAGKVLVAEDNETNCQLIVEMLQLAGCMVSTTTNGVDALAALERERFDAVLMDWHMPRLDGLAATRAWRERESMRNDARLPIIALTASVLPGDREACLQAGMDDFIAKPFTYDELIATLERWLKKQVTGDA